MSELRKNEKIVRAALIRGGIDEKSIDVVATLPEKDSFAVVAFTNDGSNNKTVRWSMPLVDGNSDITSDDGRVISAKLERDEDLQRYKEEFLGDLKSAVAQKPE